LSEGKRGVSVGVTAASSAGGFVVPNDRVDVVVTEQTPDGPRSTIILTDVRVLAIGQRLGEMGASGGQEDPTKPTTTPVVFDSSTIATLELAPAQAETLINAATLGQLSLTLRSVVDFNKATAMERAATNQTVRLIRAGREQSITAGAIQPQPAVLDASANVEPVLPSLEPQELPQ
jgi:pilus assembly protein CpaB